MMQIITLLTGYCKSIIDYDYLLNIAKIETLELRQWRNRWAGEKNLTEKVFAKIKHAKFNTLL